MNNSIRAVLLKKNSPKDHFWSHIAEITSRHLYHTLFKSFFFIDIQKEIRNPEAFKHLFMLKKKRKGKTFKKIA